VEPNIRKGSKSSVSSCTEEPEPAQSKKRTGIITVASSHGGRNQKKTSVNESGQASAHNKENRKPSFDETYTIEVVDISKESVVEKKKEQKPQLPHGVINIDIEEGLYEYSSELCVYLKQLEERFVLDKDFLVGGSVNQSMRAMLVNWLIQVQHHLHLCQETLYICISILDTTLARRDITTDKLQLVGVTAVLLASKLEEYYPADIPKLVHLTENSYTVKQILKMEKVILEVLDFQIYFPEVMSFLRRYVRAALREQDTIFMETCQYMVDASLVLATFSTHPPSMQAAASILATNCLYAAGARQRVRLGEVWSPTLEHYTGYQASLIIHLASSMLGNVIRPLHEGAWNKYKSASRHHRLVALYHLEAETVQTAKKGLELLAQD